MTVIRFWLLYILCLSLCLGSIQLAQAAWEPPQPPQEEEVTVRVIAIPPRPEGVRQVQATEKDGEVWYTIEACQKMKGQYQDICFHQLARQKATTDLKGGLEACKLIDKKSTKQECMADVAELYSPSDREAALAVCPEIQRKKWRDQCVFGIALSWSTLDSPWAFRTCDRAGQWRDFCRHDVNGEIAVVNSSLALEHCAAEEGDLLRRKSCWHGIGKYIARVNVDQAFAACEKVPLGPDRIYIENCYHGLGWGASEAQGASFAPSCQRAGQQKDSCLLGIAYNLRRFDVDAGISICGQVQRQDLLTQCKKFVIQGSLH